MDSDSPGLAIQVETVAELRKLYRAAEARAARMRLMSTSGRQLALAEADTIARILQDCANRLAYFLGFRQARWCEGRFPGGLEIAAPGSEDRVIGSVVIEGLSRLEDVADEEDREACRLHLEMMGATADRIAREREMARLLAVLEEREQRLEFVVGRLFSAQEEERIRVSHELHDGVAQTAAALARFLEGSGAAGSRDMPAGERARLARIARDLVGELRAVIRGLRPTILDDLGLEAGLQAIADGLSADGFPVQVTIDSDVRHWPPNLESALYRVAQEATTNIRKHAGGPCRIEIALTAGALDSHHFLRISDTGRGIGDGAGKSGMPAAEPGYGVAIMRERMTSIGGGLAWTASPGGVTVLASFPKQG
jgi:signal transduction histidine kinase